MPQLAGGDAAEWLLWFNSFGPAQTCAMGRVWACSHALLAGLPFTLTPLQSGFTAGIGWEFSGVLGTCPGLRQGAVNSSRGLCCQITGGRIAACADSVHFLGLLMEQGSKREESFPSF